MPFILTYILKFSISIAVVFLFYQLVLRKLTFYNWNRVYLLGYTLISFLIPFIDISSVLQQGKLTNSQVISWMPVFGLQGKDSVSQASFSAWNYLLFLFLTGIVIMTLRLIIQLVSYRQMLKRATLISNNGLSIYQVDEKIIPFSFGNAIFINQQLHTETELKEIISHEFVHVKERHSIDIIWSEILCLVNWFNPFAWLIRKAIRQNLEFIADNKVLDNGIDRKQYQYLLLKVIGNNHFSIATKFNFSSLKKRIAMMNKLKSAKINLLRFLFVLPLLAVVLLSFRKQLGDTINGKNIPYQNREIILTDTVPEVTSPNSKGYIINVKDINGECELVIKDKKGKEVKRMLLTEWNKDADKYEGLYGRIPPPPPPAPPAPPASPAKVDLPDNVQRINVNNEIATVWLKNGEKEKYDLNDNSSKQSFENKYGKIPPSPVPPVPATTPTPESYPLPQAAPAPHTPPAPSAVNPPAPLPDNVKEIIVNGSNVEILLSNGKKENYNLMNKSENYAFDKKYGKLPPPLPTAPAKPELIEKIQKPPAPPKPVREIKEVKASESNNVDVVNASAAIVML